MIDDDDYSFEDKLIWLGEISRCNIACGHYGDQQWEVWCDDGKYVEYEDHENLIKVYQQEINRLKELYK